MGQVVPETGDDIFCSDLAWLRRRRRCCAGGAMSCTKQPVFASRGHFMKQEESPASNSGR